jgi:hypothetical protein
VCVGQAEGLICVFHEMNRVGVVYLNRKPHTI